MIADTPATVLGPLFARVQEAALFDDSKTFADAEPLDDPARIVAAYEGAGPLGDDELRAFVDEHFALPPEHEEDGRCEGSVEDCIAQTWDQLSRKADRVSPHGSLLDLPRPFLVPGGRFRELYYWDSYFTMLGLVRSGRGNRVDDLLENFGSLIERFGRIPNGTRSYYLSRSQPPVLYLMTALASDRSDEARARRLEWMRTEHAFWMAGSDSLQPGGEDRRVVRLADGSLLNRYWDDFDRPRDESWREDVAVAAKSSRPSSELWRDIRAAAESGWDFSSRWMADPDDLSTIRTTRILPIDLNCLLLGLEETIAAEADALGQSDGSSFAKRAERRRSAISRHFWNDSLGCFADYDLDQAEACGNLTAAAAFPLFTGMADAEQGASTGRALASLLRPGGLVTTARTTTHQWDAPNGWAPLQWIAVVGLRRYGHDELARQITQRWVAMVEDVHAQTGQLLEKYDVEARTGGGGGEYGNEVGFGWTNGVHLVFLEAGK